MLITVWETAFPGTSVPEAIAYVQAIAFLVSRFQTTVNVASDLFIVRMIQISLDADRKKLAAGGDDGAPRLLGHCASLNDDAKAM
jgi:Na+/H+-dicarboxylate symporter